LLSAVLALWTISGSSHNSSPLFVHAFSSARYSGTRIRSATTTELLGATTVEPPTREKTDRDTKKQSYDEDDIADMDDPNQYDDLEYLIDSEKFRDFQDPFHILLMGSTFEKPKISVTYVATALEYVLNMPNNEGKELSNFAKEEGFSCLGTWPREKCLIFGKQLQMRDIVCRVVPFCEGGQRGWQAKDANDASYGSSSIGGGGNSGDYFG